MKVGQIEFNAETGEETFTERELTAAEIKAKEARDKVLADQEAALAQKAADRAALLAQLGITEEQAKLLLG
jgi:hypothetical protein